MNAPILRIHLIRGGPPIPPREPDTRQEMLRLLRVGSIVPKTPRREWLLMSLEQEGLVIRKRQPVQSGHAWFITDAGRAALEGGEGVGDE